MAARRASDVPRADRVVVLINPSYRMTCPPDSVRFVRRWTKLYFHAEACRNWSDEYGLLVPQPSGTRRRNNAFAFDDCPRNSPDVFLHRHSAGTAASRRLECEARIRQR